MICSLMVHVHIADTLTGFFFFFFFWFFFFFTLPPATGMGGWRVRGPGEIGGAGGGFFFFFFLEFLDTRMASRARVGGVWLYSCLHCILW